MNTSVWPLSHGENFTFLMLGVTCVQVARISVAIEGGVVAQVELGEVLGDLVVEQHRASSLSAEIYTVLVLIRYLEDLDLCLSMAMLHIVGRVLVIFALVLRVLLSEIQSDLLRLV